MFAWQHPQPRLSVSVHLLCRHNHLVPEEKGSQRRLASFQMHDHNPPWLPALPNHPVPLAISAPLPLPGSLVTPPVSMSLQQTLPPPTHTQELTPILSSPGTRKSLEESFFVLPSPCVPPPPSPPVLRAVVHMSTQMNLCSLSPTLYSRTLFSPCPLPCHQLKSTFQNCLI